jgi:hypothetical protein
LGVTSKNKIDWIIILTLLFVTSNKELQNEKVRDKPNNFRNQITQQKIQKFEQRQH